MADFNSNNYSREIIDLICEDFKDDEQLVMDALNYLLFTTKDERMKNQIVDIFKDYGYVPSFLSGAMKKF